MYEYTMVFRGTQAHGNTDALLSRLPLPITDGEEPSTPELVLLLDHLVDSVSYISRWTRRDPVLSQVLQFVL